MKSEKITMLLLLMGTISFSHAQCDFKENPFITICYPPSYSKIFPPRIELIKSTNSFPFESKEKVIKYLIVYNTVTKNDLTPGLYYWDGDKWIRLTDDDILYWRSLKNSSQSQLFNIDESKCFSKNQLE